MPLHLQWCNKRKIGRFLYTVKAHKSRQDTVELSLPPIEILVFRLKLLGFTCVVVPETQHFKGTQEILEIWYRRIVGTALSHHLVLLVLKAKIL